MPILDNPKHEHFCQLIAQDYAASTAYGIAFSNKGTAPRGANQSASRLLTKADIAARVDELRTAIREKGTEKAGLDRAKVLNRLEEVLIKCLEPVPIIGKSGAVVGEKIDSAGALRAIELQGRELGMFSTGSKVDMSVSGNGGGSLVDLLAALQAKREAEPETTEETPPEPIPAADPDHDHGGTVH